MDDELKVLRKKLAVARFGMLLFGIISILLVLLIIGASHDLREFGDTYVCAKKGVVYNDKVVYQVENTSDWSKMSAWERYIVVSQGSIVSTGRGLAVVPAQLIEVRE